MLQTLMRVDVLEPKRTRETDVVKVASCLVVRAMRQGDVTCSDERLRLLVLVRAGEEGENIVEHNLHAELVVAHTHGTVKGHEARQLLRLGALRGSRGIDGRLGGSERHDKAWQAERNGEGKKRGRGSRSTHRKCAMMRFMLPHTHTHT